MDNNLTEQPIVEPLGPEVEGAWSGKVGMDIKMQFVPWEQISKKEFPEQQWRIKGILPQQGFAIIASISGERKTWLAMYMARCIAAGEDFLGREEFKTTPGNVLYVDMEQSEREFQRRGKLLGLKESNNKIYVLNRDDIDFSEYEAKMYLRARIKSLKIDVVIIDTFRAIAGGIKEEKAEEVREFFDGFREFKNSNVSILWLDHLRKPTRFEGDIPKKEQLLGSQDKTACCEVLMMMRSQAGSDDISFYQFKNRLAPEIKPFKITMVDIVDDSLSQIGVSLSYAGQIEATDIQKDRAKGVILAALTSGEKSRQELLDIVNTEAKVGGRNTSDGIRELMTANKIGMHKKGRQNYYFLPESPENELPPLFTND